MISMFLRSLKFSGRIKCFLQHSSCSAVLNVTIFQVGNKIVITVWNQLNTVDLLESKWTRYYCHFHIRSNHGRVFNGNHCEPLWWPLLVREVVMRSSNARPHCIIPGIACFQFSLLGKSHAAQCSNFNTTL